MRTTGKSDIFRVHSSTNARLYSFENALPIVRDNLLFGTGLRTGATVLEASNERIRSWNDIQQREWAVDNLYLSLLLEQGIIGFLFMFGFILVLVIRSVRALRRNVYDVFGLAVFVSTIGLCLNALTFEIFVWWSIFVLFWIDAGLLYSLTSPNKKGYFQTSIDCL